MKATLEQEVDLQKLFSTHAGGQCVSLEQTLQAFSELKYSPSKKDSQLIFDTLKSKGSDKLTYQQFEFWWKELRSVSSQEYLVKAYVKIFKANKKLKERFIMKEKQKENLMSDNFKGVLIRAGFGEVQTGQKQVKFRLNFKNGLTSSVPKEEEKASLRTMLQLEENSLAFVAQIQLSQNADKEKCAKDLQQLIKSILTVCTSLHKGTKQLLSKVNITTKIANGNAFIIAKLEKSVESMILNIIQTVQEYLDKIQPAEEFDIKFLMQNDLLSLLQAVKDNDPKKTFPKILNNSEFKISTLACRFFQIIAESEELEKLNLPQFQLIFAFLTLLRTFKFDLQFKNLSENDIWLNEFDYLLPHLGNEKVHLPNMNIIKKIKDFCFNYLESFFKVHLFGPKVKGKVQFCLPNLSSVIKECVE